MSEENKKESAFIKGLTDEESATNAISKLNKDPIKLSVFRHTALVQQLEAGLDKIDEELKNAKSDSEKKSLNDSKKTVKKQLAKEENIKIEGYLTTITYRDVMDIKAAVTEAVVHFNRYNFDIDVKMARIVAEERYMTVFCALKKADKVTPYFAELKDIVEIDDTTIFDIYDLWDKAFVVTSDELKN